MKHPVQAVSYSSCLDIHLKQHCLLIKARLPANVSYTCVRCFMLPRPWPDLDPMTWPRYCEDVLLRLSTNSMNSLDRQRNRRDWTYYNSYTHAHNNRLERSTVEIAGQTDRQTDEQTRLDVHCNLVITLMMGAKRKERYNEMSVITK